jgi:tripartite-type tricarboxylate transporter receptor subunit TctC
MGHPTGAAILSRRRFLANAASHTLVAGGAVASAGIARAQASRYPSRPVTIVVPFAPGGMADIVARPLAHALQRELGQPFIVMSRPGAAGGIGIQSVANAPPDGHTLLLTLASISTLPLIAEATGERAPFRREDFAPIARLAADPSLIYVHRDAPWRTVEELIADARARPEAISFTSSGVNGPTHLPLEMLMEATGTRMLHVPATGGGPAMNLLLGRHVDIFFTIPALGMAHVTAGTLRVLALSAAQRIAALPEVPTLYERGIPVDYSVWAGLFARHDVDPDIRTRLEVSVGKVAADPAFRASLDSAGIVQGYQDAATFAGWWDADARRLASVLRRINSRG